MSNLLFDEARTLVILVGVYKYDHPDKLPNIDAGSRNLQTLRNLILDDRILGVKRNHVLVLDNLTHSDAERKISKILSGKAEGPENERIQISRIDTLMFYYVGHAKKIDGELRLTFRNTETDAFIATTLTFSFLSKLIKNASNIQNRVYILDCCYAAQASKSQHLKIDEQMNLFSDKNLRLKGTLLIASSSADSPSGSGEGKDYTDFTGEFINLLAKGLDYEEHINLFKNIDLKINKPIEIINLMTMKYFFKTMVQLPFPPVIENFIRREFENDFSNIGLFKNIRFNISNVEEKLSSSHSSHQNFGIDLFKAILESPNTRLKHGHQKILSIGRAIVELEFQKEFGDEDRDNSSR